MNNIGIWMDKEKAHIVRLAGEQERFETLLSDLDFFKPSGGSRTRTAKWGPQDVVQDSKYLEKEKHQLKRYFDNLIEAIGSADAIALFGPGDTIEKFEKELRKSHKGLASKLKTITKADSMTDNQIKALARDCFRQKE